MGSADLSPALIPHAWRIRLHADEWQALGLFPEARLGAWLKQLLGQHEGETAALWWPLWPRNPHTRLAAGSELEFALLALPAALPQARILLDRLRTLPGSSNAPPNVPFGRGLRCAGIVALDGGDQSVLTEAIEQTSMQLLEHPHWRWCWRSPARLRRSGARQGEGENRFIHHERDLDGGRLTALAGDTLQALQQALQPSAATIALPVLSIIASELFWLDLHYRDSEGRHKACGGLLGEMLLKRPDDLTVAQARQLALVMYLGCGQRRAFGLSQFALESIDGLSFKREPDPPPSLLKTLGRVDLLQQARWRKPVALEAVDSESTFPAEDPAADPLGALDGWLQRAADRWQSGQLIPATALHPVDLPKPHGGVRRLLVPRLGERIVQRALLDALAPAVDLLFAERSYGFRPGRSRMQAHDRLLALYERGLRVIGESDVSEFFDQVEYWRIAVRLRALFGTDPVVQQMLEFIAAPVRTEGEPQARERGLPQGAPLSPWLSNLLLDDLDHDLAHAGFEAVRYADDFVIATRTVADAEAGLQLAALSLAEKGLSLKGNKSRITSFDQGFSFLGYQFVGALAVEIKGKPAIFTPDPQLLEDLAAHSPEPTSEFGGLPDLPAADELGPLLIVSKPQSTLATRDGQLHARWPDGSTASWPLAQLAAVVLIGPQRLTSNALQGLLAANLPVHIADGRGRWLGATTPWPKPAEIDLWMRQQQRFRQAAFCLNLSQAIVFARIRHQGETLRRRLAGTAPVLEELDQLAQRAQQATDLASLRGFEGAAARAYFAALTRLIPDELAFNGLQKRPPRDPFNALLSLGAVVLHTRVDLNLRALGLLPTAGFYHQPHGSHATLASDLIEPVRHRVERTALGLIRRNMLRAEHFRTEDNGACRLLPAPKRLFFEALEREFATPARLLGATEAGTLNDHLRLQVFSLIAAIDQIGPFHAIRYR